MARLPLHLRLGYNSLRMSSETKPAVAKVAKRKGSLPGERRGGRQKGVPNKLSGNVKENIVAVFTRLGGTAAMAEWAEDNKTEFYRLYAKLLPMQVTGQDGEALKVMFNVVLSGPPEK